MWSVGKGDTENTSIIAQGKFVVCVLNTWAIVFQLSRVVDRNFRGLTTSCVTLRSRTSMFSCVDISPRNDSTVKAARCAVSVGSWRRLTRWQKQLNFCPVLVTEIMTSYSFPKLSGHYRHLLETACTWCRVCQNTGCKQNMQRLLFLQTKTMLFCSKLFGDKLIDQMPWCKVGRRGAYLYWRSLVKKNVNMLISIIRDTFDTI